jgi:anaerobic ribonucleoside-triphosphate reductase activating protein
VIRVHAIEPRSRANGPGVRCVVWLQGCTLGCAGCFNPATHALGGREVTEVDQVFAPPFGGAARSGAPDLAFTGATGLTLSGGEPLQQAAGCVELLDAARARGLSTLAFSGYSIEEIRALPHGPDVLARLDVLIDGRYVAAQRLASGLRGSANQRIHLLTDRHTLAEVEDTPVAEVRISPTGELVLTGVDPLKLPALRRR